jgi:hypothetical protein
LNYKQYNQCRGHKAYYRRYINTDIFINNTCIVSDCKIKSGISIYVQNKGVLKGATLNKVTLNVSSAGIISDVIA